MKFPCLLACCALLGSSLAACGFGSMPDPGAPTEDAQGRDPDNLLIAVHGRVELLPEAVQLLAAEGQPPPTLAGLPLVIEEPLRVAVGDSGAILGAGTLSEKDGFFVPDVPVKDIHLSLAAGVEHESLARTSTIIFDTAFTGARPRTDLIDSRVWAVPQALHDAFTRAVGPEDLRTLSEGRARTLLEAGFVLGRVVDAAGQPVAGARVRLDRAELADRLYYLSEDLAHANQTGTSTNGLFLYIHSGSDAETFRVGIQDTEAYLWRNASATPGRGLVLTLFPGSYPP